MVGCLTPKTKSLGSNAFCAGRIILEFIEYALVFTVIAECNSMFNNSENYLPTLAGGGLTLIGILLAAVLVLIYGLRAGKSFAEDMKNNRVIWLAVLGCVILFFAVNVVRKGGENAVTKYLFSFVLFLPLAYCLFRLYRLAGKPNELFYKHANIVCFIAILNLMVYLCVTLNPYVVQVQLTQTHWGGLGQLKTWNNYLNVCIVTSANRNILGFTIFRNYGFTTEPLMYSIPLVTALYTEMFLRPKQQRKVWKMIVLFAAIFTTQSTLALLIAVGTIGLKFFLVSKEKKKKWFYLPITLAVLAVAFLLIRQKQETGSGSFAAHVEHYRASLEAFLHHPFFGNGYVNEPAVVAFVKESVSAGDQGLSNSVAVVLAEGGLLLAGICMAPFIILFCQIRKHNAMKNVALWAVGPFGLYCLTIVHFHLLLLLWMAFGCAMLEIKTPPEEQKRRLALADDIGATEADETERTASKTARGVQVALISLIVICQALLLLSAKLWKSLFAFLKSNQLLFGQSTWKVYCFSLFLLLAVIVINDWVGVIEKKKQPALTKEMLFFVLYTVLFLCFYPTIYSWVRTAFGSVRFLGDVIETFVVAVLYFGVIFAAWLILYFFSFDKKLAAVSFVCVAVCALLFSGWTVKRIKGVPLETDTISSCLAEAEKSETGKLYANAFPAAWKSRLPEIEYCGAAYGAFAVMEDASVITAHNDVLPELLESGYEVTELSDSYVLYSNDEALISSLKGKGYPFYMYYPYDLDTEEEAAKKLSSGKYTLTADLHLLSSDIKQDEPVCQMSATYCDGKFEAFRQEIHLDQFDENGNCTVAIPFTAGDWDRIEYTFSTENENAVQLSSMAIRQTPAEIVRREYDGRHLAVLESYYDLEGNPNPKEEVYYAIAKKYNRMGWLVEQDYLGENGELVVLGRGYASFSREYDQHGQLTKEQYYDEYGHVCIIKNGYASFEREYNKKRQLVKEAYYSEDDQPCVIPQGYAFYTREYDDAGNVRYYRYYDLSGGLTMTTSGYAVLHREYNEKRKIVYEAYFGAEEEPVALSNGVASYRIEYDSDGKESDRTYYDLQGAVLHLDS